MPPLWVIGAEGDGQLVNYRVHGRFIIVDRLFAAAELRLVLERQPGYAGLEDQVDNQWGLLVKAAVLTTLLSIGSEAGTTGDENDLIQAIRRSGSQSVNQIIGRLLVVQPTLTIRPGFPVRVLVTRDLMLEPYEDRTS